MLRIAAIALLGACCAACAGGPQLPDLASGTALSNLTTGSLNLSGSEPSMLPMTSAEVYSRIARGANACWFGPRGRIARSHILHADADPSMNGGAVEIVVHERAADQPKPWGYKAYRVSLTESAGLDGTPGAGGTRIAVENARIEQREAARMREEVFLWASGTEGCRTDPELDKAAEPVKADPPPPPAKQRTRTANPR